MRTIKLISLTALAALAATALVAASSAMAETTALCNVDPAGTEVCPAGNLVSHVHEETLPGHKAILLNSSLIVECNVSFLGDTKVLTQKGELIAGSLGNPLHIVGTFTYTSCTPGCTVGEQFGPADLVVLKLGHELADVTGKGEVKVNCAFGFIKCVYNGTGLNGHALGPLLSEEANGEVRLEEQETHIVSGSCPAKAFLDILTTPSTKIWIKS